MIEIKIPDFCMEQIANSGQCFRISELSPGKRWKVLAFGKMLKIQQIDGGTYAFYCSEEEYKNVWMDYFDLKRDYGEIRSAILKINDPYLCRAVDHGFGLKILRQDPWETMVSFIISQRNSIPRIKNIIEKLCAPHGGCFPSPQILMKYDVEDFRSIGLGYRAKYLMDISRAVDAGKFDIEYLKKMNCEEAIKYMKRFNGIGEKVANCIALYGLHKIEAFPVDVWISRIIDKRYGGIFDTKRFPGYAGVVQQYMFFYQRSLER